MVFTFLVRFLDHDFQNLEARTFPEEAPKVLRTIGYPAHISKQTFQSLGTMHSWPAALAILDFLLKRAKLAKLSIANSRETINSIAFIIFFTGITILWILVIADVRIWAPYCLVPICITSSILLFCGAKKENKAFLAIHLFLTASLILFSILFPIFKFGAIGIEIANGIKPMKLDEVEHNEMEGKTYDMRMEFGAAVFILGVAFFFSVIACLQIYSLCMVYKFTKQLPTKRS